MVSDIVDLSVNHHIIGTLLSGINFPSPLRKVLIILALDRRKRYFLILPPLLLTRNNQCSLPDPLTSCLAYTSITFSGIHVIYAYGHCFTPFFFLSWILASRKKYIESLGGSELAERIEKQNQIYSSFHYHIHRRSINEFLPPASHVKQPVEVILFVGHANVFRYWLCRALQLPLEAWLRISLPHGSITELLVEASAKKKTCTVVALRVGDDGHMPIELISR